MDVSLLMSRPTQHAWHSIIQTVLLLKHSYRRMCYFNSMACLSACCVACCDVYQFFCVKLGVSPAFLKPGNTGDTKKYLEALMME